MAARVRVYPEFADVQSVQPDSIRRKALRPLRDFHHAALQRCNAGYLVWSEPFSGLERAFSNLSRADSLSLGISVSRQFSDSSDATRSSEPTSDGQLRLSDSVSVGRIPPQATFSSKLRLWLAAYVSVADYVTDVYTISVRRHHLALPSLPPARCPIHEHAS